MCYDQLKVGDMARDLFMTIRVSKDEKASLVKKARDSDLEISTYIRQKLDLSATTTAQVQSPSLNEVNNER